MCCGRARSTYSLELFDNIYVYISCAQLLHKSIYIEPRATGEMRVVQNVIVLQRARDIEIIETFEDYIYLSDFGTMLSIMLIAASGKNNAFLYALDFQLIYFISFFSHGCAVLL